MPFRPAVPKFLGTISLGLLTGLSYTLATAVYPALLLLPSATQASRTFASISLSAQRHATALATLSFLSFTASYLLSPRRAAHPYLLYTALLTLGANSPDIYALGRSLLVGGPSTLQTQETKSPSQISRSTHLNRSGGEEEWEDVVGEQGVNGEEVEKRVRNAQLWEIKRGVVNALAFALGVVGLWGDAA